MTDCAILAIISCFTLTVAEPVPACAVKEETSADRHHSVLDVELCKTQRKINA